MVKYPYVHLSGLSLRTPKLLRQHLDVVLLLQIFQPEHLNLLLQLMNWVKLH